MFSSFISLLISLIFVVFVLSMLATAFQEYLANKYNQRGKFLKDQLQILLRHDSTIDLDYAHLLYTHPLIVSLRDKPGRYPAYIGAKAFSKALIDIVGRNAIVYNVQRNDAGPETTLIPNDDILDKENENFNPAVRFANGVRRMKQSELRRVFELIVDNSKKLNSQTNKFEIDYDKLQSGIMEWFDNQMNRANGFYKTKIQSKLFWYGLLMAVLINADFIQISNVLWHDGRLREALASKAVTYVETHKDDKKNTATDTATIITTDTTQTPEQKYESLRKEYTELSIPVGWALGPISSMKCRPIEYLRKGDIADDKYRIADSNIVYLLFKIAGWLLTAFLVRQGSPFWFQLLMKVVNLRSTGIKPSSSSKQF